MKIYTRKGDRGTCAVFGGTRVDKDDVRVECLGAFDEANSTLGLLRAKLGPGHPWQERLHRIQRDLMDMMSHLARPSGCARENPNPLPSDGAGFCEGWIDELEASLKAPSDYFLLPGGTELSALCHMARTQMRRAERRLVSLARADRLPEPIMPYVNRLSDLFFTLSRAALEEAGVEEERWRLFLYKKKSRLPEGP